MQLDVLTDPDVDYNPVFLNQLVRKTGVQTVTMSRAMAMQTSSTIGILAHYETLQYEPIPHVILRITASEAIDFKRDLRSVVSCGPWCHADHLQILFGAGEETTEGATVHALHIFLMHNNLRWISLGLVATHDPGAVGGQDIDVSDYFVEYVRLLLMSVEGTERGGRPAPFRAVWDSSRLRDARIRLPSGPNDDTDDDDDAYEWLWDTCRQAYSECRIGDVHGPVCVMFCRYIIRRGTPVTSGLWQAVRCFLGRGWSHQDRQRRGQGSDTEVGRKRVRYNAAPAVNCTDDDSD